MQRKQSILDTNAQCFETFACSKSARVIEKGESRMETSRDCTVDGPEVPNPIRSTLRESSVKLSNFNSVSKLMKISSSAGQAKATSMASSMKQYGIITSI